MRKILDKSDDESKKKKNSIIIGVMLVGLMIFSTLGYAYYSSSWNSQNKGKSMEYAGIEFQETSYGSWLFNIQGHNFETAYSPDETQDISVILVKNIQDYTNLPLYFGVNKEEEINTRGISEISVNLNDFILRSGIACLNEDCEGDYPIKNCSDNMIIFQEDDFLRVRDEEGCVYIYTNETDVERVSDAFIYKILGIQ